MKIETLTATTELPTLDAPIFSLSTGEIISVEALTGLAGIEGQKSTGHTHEVRDALFIVPQFVLPHDHLGNEAQFSVPVKAGDEPLVAPLASMRRILAAKAMDSIASQCNAAPVDSRLPKVEIKVNMPVALLKQSNTSNEMRVHTLLNPDGSNSDNLLEELTIKAGRGWENDARLKVAVAYPKIPGFSSKMMEETIIHLSPLERMSVNLACLRLNREMINRGIYWQDQGKSPDNYLLVRGDDGVLTVVMNDFDISVFNEPDFAKSDTAKQTKNSWLYHRATITTGDYENFLKQADYPPELREIFESLKVADAKDITIDTWVAGLADLTHRVSMGDTKASQQQYFEDAIGTYKSVLKEKGPKGLMEMFYLSEITSNPKVMELDALLTQRSQKLGEIESSLLTATTSLSQATSELASLLDKQKIVSDEVRQVATQQEELKSSNSLLDQQIAELDTRVKSLTAEKEALTEEKMTLDKELGEKRGEYNALTFDIHDLELTMEVLSQSRKECDESLQSAMEAKLNIVSIEQLTDKEKRVVFKNLLETAVAEMQLSADVDVDSVLERFYGSHEFDREITTVREVIQRIASDGQDSTHSISTSTDKLIINLLSGVLSRGNTELSQKINFARAKHNRHYGLMRKAQTSLIKMFGSGTQEEVEFLAIVDENSVRKLGVNDNDWERIQAAQALYRQTRDQTGESYSKLMNVEMDIIETAFGLNNHKQSLN